MFEILIQNKLIRNITSAGFLLKLNSEQTEKYYTNKFITIFKTDDVYLVCGYIWSKSSAAL